MSCGIAMSVRGWSGASVLVTVSPDADTFTPSADGMTAVDVMAELTTWYDHASRPWTSMGSTWTAEADGSGRLTFRFVAGTAATSLAPNATMQTRLRLALGAGAPVGTSRGTCGATPGTVGWDRHDTERGSRARVGSYRSGHRTLSLRRPSCDVALHLADAWALTEAQRLAAHPLTAWVWDEYTSNYRRVFVGAIDLTPQRESPARIEGTIQIWGVV